MSDAELGMALLRMPVLLVLLMDAVAELYGVVLSTPLYATAHMAWSAVCAKNEIRTECVPVDGLNNTHARANSCPCAVPSAGISDVFAPELSQTTVDNPPKIADDACVYPTTKRVFGSGIDSGKSTPVDEPVVTYVETEETTAMAICYTN